jgi:hypothetical protein
MRALTFRGRQGLRTLVPLGVAHELGVPATGRRQRRFRRIGSCTRNCDFSGILRDRSQLIAKRMERHRSQQRGCVE